MGVYCSPEQDNWLGKEPGGSSTRHCSPKAPFPPAKAYATSVGDTSCPGPASGSGPGGWGTARRRVWAERRPGALVACGDSLGSQPGQQGLSWVQGSGNSCPNSQEQGKPACGWGQAISQPMVAHLQGLLLRGPRRLLQLLSQFLQL